MMPAGIACRMWLFTAFKIGQWHDKPLFITLDFITPFLCRCQKQLPKSCNWTRAQSRRQAYSRHCHFYEVISKVVRQKNITNKRSTESPPLCFMSSLLCRVSVRVTGDYSVFVASCSGWDRQRGWQVHCLLR